MKTNINHHLNPQAAVRHGGLSILSGTAASKRVKWRMSLTYEHCVWFNIYLCLVQPFRFCQEEYSPRNQLRKVKIETFNQNI